MYNLDIEKYIELHSSEETSILKKLNRETNLKVLMPRMLSGHLQGKFLEMISLMIKPRQILEIGTYTGYSAICLSAGFCKGGIIHTIEKNSELEDIANRYFNKAGIKNKVKFYLGDAMNIIPDINEIFDLVFIDADKENYLNYYNLVFNKVRKGGFIIADNALWDGKVIESDYKDDKETIGIVRFNDYVQKDKRVENMILPLRDGLMIIRKL